MAFRLSRTQFDSLDYGEDALEEDMEDSPPQIKHCTLENDLLQILSSDRIASMAVHSKFLVIGTHWGSIYILDHLGNKIRSKEISPHSTTVNHISIEPAGEYIASCSDDGRVVITGLYNNEEDQIFSFDRPVRAVALSPTFSSARSKRQFVMGDDRLMLASKGIFEVLIKKPKTEILHSGEGPIRNIQWCGIFIAWANDLGVKVYDMSERNRITYVRRSGKDIHLRPEIHRCNLFWCPDGFTFLIAWGSKVQMVRIKMQDDPHTARARGLPSRCAEIVQSFDYDTDYICGVTLFKNDTLLLCYPKPSSEESTEKASPRLVLIRAEAQSYEELFSYPLPMHNSNASEFRDRYYLYQLSSLPSENIHFVLSPTEVATIQPTDLDDNVGWLVERGRFEKALRIAEHDGKQLQRYDKTKIGKMYIEYLLLHAQFERVASLAPSIFSRDKEGWQELIDRFYHAGYLLLLADSLPFADPNAPSNPSTFSLDTLYYELVLNECIRFQPAQLLCLLKRWPQELYDRETVLNALSGRLDFCSSDDPHIEPLRLCLALLHEFQGKFDEAAQIYISMRRPEAFTLISTHHLYDLMTRPGMTIELMRLDSERAVKLFIENIDYCPPEKTVSQLAGSSDLQFEYLYELFKRDPNLSRPFHTRLIELLARKCKKTGDSRELLHFLKNSDSYDLQEALEICTGQEITQARVYLLVRVGRSRDALRLIIECKQNLDEAIAFCRESGDRELWDDLFELCLASSHTEFVAQLLREAGMDADPRQLIRKIQPGLRIPKLRDSVVKLLFDYHVQIALREGYNQIVRKDWQNLLMKQIAVQRKAVMVPDPNQLCPICSGAILSKRNASEVVMFHCSHAFHAHCLSGFEDDGSRVNCHICAGPSN